MVIFLLMNVLKPLRLMGDGKRPGMDGLKMEFFFFLRNLGII